MSLSVTHRWSYFASRVWGPVISTLFPQLLIGVPKSQFKTVNFKMRKSAQKYLGPQHCMSSSSLHRRSHIHSYIQTSFSMLKVPWVNVQFLHTHNRSCSYFSSIYCYLSDKQLWCPNPSIHHKGKKN